MKRGNEWGAQGNEEGMGRDQGRLLYNVGMRMGGKILITQEGNTAEMRIHHWRTPNQFYGRNQSMFHSHSYHCNAEIYKQ